jgi:DNA-3-methyladenine glycosylase II
MTKRFREQPLFDQKERDLAIGYLQTADPILATLIAEFAPFPVGETHHETQSKVGSADHPLLLGLCRAIFYQSVSIPSANAVYSRFLALYPHADFPSARDIANTADETLKSIGLPRSKVSYLKHLAVAELPELGELERMSDREVIERLIQLKGVGIWTAQMVLIFQLKRLDVFPIADLGLRAAIRDLYELEQLPDRAVLERFGNKWQPYRTIATWYLWQSRGSAAKELLKAWC